ncbi:MAG TPA: hypothetical protein VFB62_01735 [Polyangiaceae bacterium]|nr:hypothetical protein [Polyangiaceae bacterium]
MLLVAAALLALAQAHPWGCGTPVRVDAAQRLSRANIDRWSAPLPPLAHWVDASEPFPLRVYFDAPEQQPYAERIVAAVGVAYQRTVTEWGFWPPLLVEGEPYYIYIGDPGAGAAAYTAPYLANAATPHEDAFTYIVVRPGLSDVALDVTVAHELNHASQAAMDMSEPSAFFESTATYVESLVFPAGAALAGQLITVFQSQAHLPLEYAAPGPSDGYEYGASLWLSFLAHVYGADDPAWIRALWEESVQVGPTNEPDHRDVLDGWLADRGGQAHAIEEFGRWRFFVGAYADEQHLPSADKWQEVPFSASYTTTQLPVLDKGPQAATRPRPSGCNYASLSLGGSETLPIRFRFEGDAALAWDVSVLEIALDATSSYQVMELGEDARGELRIEPDDVHRAVLVICQSIADGFDLDEKTWPAGDYRYDIEVDVPAPTILEATPTAIERGVHGADIVLRGDGFVEGLTVALSGEHAAVHDVRVLSKSEIQAKLTIAPSAALGSRDVIVTNPGGAFATATGMLDIVEPQTSSSSESAGGCSIGSFGSRPVWLLASLALLACRRRRASAFLAAALVFGIASVAHAGPPSDGYVESATHPIRVHYANGANAAVAQEALGYAEEAWQKLFVELGFPEPTTLDDNDAPIPGIWLYVDPTSANLAQALGDNAATPHTDCLTRIFVASTSPSTILKSIVVTEMTQATTLTVDCGESVFAWKSAGVALASYVAPDDTLFPTVMLPVFQASPHAGLDCVFQGDMFWYHYGAALFWRFVDEAYGQGDGALLASLWEASKQNGTVLSTGTGVGVLDVDNEPDVLDAVATVAVPFDEAFSEFTRWRYFVGTRDDGQHFADGSKWFGAEVGIDRQLTLAELPVVAAAPVMPLADYGSSYIELDLSG